MKKRIALVLCRPLVLLLLSECLVRSQAEPKPLRIIDMHLHALRLADFGVGLGPSPAVCSSNENIVWYGWDPRKPFTIGGSGLSCTAARFVAPTTDEDLMRQTLTMLDRYNIRAVTSGDSGLLDDVSKWRAAAPDRIIPAASFRRPGHDPQGRPLYRPISELRRLVADGKIVVFAEVAPQYDGMSPADPLLDPYFALAEELDISNRPPHGRRSARRSKRGRVLEISRQDGQSLALGRSAH